MEELVADRDRGREIAAAAKEYVRRLHDGRRSAELLDDFLKLVAHARRDRSLGQHLDDAL